MLALINNFSLKFKVSVKIAAPRPSPSPAAGKQASDSAGLAQGQPKQLGSDGRVLYPLSFGAPRGEQSQHHPSSAHSICKPNFKPPPLLLFQAAGGEG